MNAGEVGYIIGTFIMAFAVGALVAALTAWLSKRDTAAWVAGATVAILLVAVQPEPSPATWAAGLLAAACIWLRYRWRRLRPVLPAASAPAQRALVARPLRERILVALWALTSLWCCLWVFWLLVAAFGDGSDGAVMAGVSLLAIAVAVFGSALIQYVCIGYASPKRLFARKA